MVEAALTVHLDIVPGRSHNLYDEIVQAPPAGVRYVFAQPANVGVAPSASAESQAEGALSRARRSPAFRRAYAPVLRHLMGGVGVKARLAAWRGERPPWDLMHSTGGIHALPEPWVVSFESSLGFFGLGQSVHVEIHRAGPRRYARRKLLGRHCRRLLPWTDAARRSVLTTFPEAADELDAKMEVVPLAIRAGPPPPPRAHDRPPRLLFVGSRNFPQDFLVKGGHLALEAFERLRKTHRDVEMVVRAAVPEPYRSRYHGMAGLTFIEGFLSDEEMHRLYVDADIFVYPSCYTPGMAILEAMRAGLPAVMLDVWANAEVVAHGKTGLLVPGQAHVRYVNERGALGWNSTPEFLGAIQSDTSRVVGDLVDALGKLVEDPSLCRSMGRNARAEIETGRFSIAQRNRALRRIYDEAVSGR